MLFLLLVGVTVGGCTLLFWSAALSWGWLGGGLPPASGFGALFPRLLVVGAVFFAVGGVVWSVRAFRRVMAPTGDVIEAVGRVADGDYAVRVDERGPREVRALGEAFNRMAGRLERGEAQRRQLMADVAHELRTPLTVIQGNLEGLLDGVYPRDDAHLAPILEETRLLARLIDDVRTLALAESGSLNLQREKVNVGGLLDETVVALGPQADAAGVALTADAQGALPELELDRVRIREVLANLVTNALRYTGRGGHIQLRARAAGTDVVVEVADTGKGMPAEELARVFERMYKSSDSPGLGLGLPIARSLVEAHGGEMTAESEPGKGTTVRFRLPTGTR